MLLARKLCHPREGYHFEYSDIVLCDATNWKAKAFCVTDLMNKDTKTAQVENV